MKFTSVIVALLFLCSLGSASEVKSMHPKADSKDLLLPANYHDWVKLSPATVGMPVHQHKHLVNKFYVEPAAFEHFSKTGEWPNRTVIVMELLSSTKSKARETDVMGLEAAVKDEAQFPNSWSYYGIVFDRPQEKKAEESVDPVLAMAFPTLRSVINAKPSTIPSPMF